MTPERFAIGDGPVRTLYPGTRYGERLAAERNAAVGSRIDAQPARSPAKHIGHVPRIPSARDGRTGYCRRVVDQQTGAKCGAPFTFAGAPNRLYCDACSAGVQKRGRG